MAHLLGECRREMNGAVVGSMRYYGAEYGLNYGVSLPTLRTLAQGEGCDHNFARLLFMQQVRELRLCSLWIADPQAIRSTADLEFWAEGIINSEVAEEASFALFRNVELVVEWLTAEDIILVYCALLSISKGNTCLIVNLEQQLLSIASMDHMLLANALITLLELSYRVKENQQFVEQLIAKLPSTNRANYIRSELEWRLDSFE